MNDTYRITLADGTALTGLTLNGNNFVSSLEVTEATFAGKLSPVTIYQNDLPVTHEHMELVQAKRYGAEWWFILRDVPAEELERAQLRTEVTGLTAQSAEVDAALVEVAGMVAEHEVTTDELMAAMVELAGMVAELAGNGGVA